MTCVKSHDSVCNACDQGTGEPLRHGSPIPVRWSHNGRRALGRGPVRAEHQGFAPLSDDEDFDTEHVESAQDEPLRPWTLLGKTWDPFIEYLGDCWWGDISLSTIVEYMGFSVDGEMIIAGPTSTDPGIVCSVFVRARTCIITHNITLYGCKYKCPTVTDESFSSLINCVSHIVSTVQCTVILSPRRHGRDQPFRLFGAPCRVSYGGELDDTQSPLRAMVAEIAELPDSNTWFRRANKVTGEHITFADIQECVSQSQYSYGVIVYNANRNMAGYLFDIVTADKTMVMTFSQRLGYATDVDGYTVCCPTIKRLMAVCRCSNMICLHSVDVAHV